MRLEAHVEFEWNGGKPKTERAQFYATPQRTLAIPFARAAFARHGEPFIAELAGRCEQLGKNGWAAGRLISIASWVFAPLKREPPAALDHAAFVRQKTWTYVQPDYRAYAALLGASRREALVLRSAREGEPAPELASVASTPAIKAALR